MWSEHQRQEALATRRADQADHDRRCVAFIEDCRRIGWSYRQIAAMLNEAGDIPSPNRNADNWTPAAVYRIAKRNKIL